MNSRVWLSIFLVMACLNPAFCSQADAIYSPGAKNDINLNLSQVERAWLEDHPIMRLGIEGGYPPYFFRDEQGHFQGIAVEYAGYIEKKLGVTLELVAVAKDEIRDKRAGLDVIITLPVTAEADNEFDLSNIFLSTPYVIMKREGKGGIQTAEDLNGRTVAFDDREAFASLLKTEFPEIIPVPVRSPLEGLVAVATGRAEAYIGEEGSSLYLSERTGIDNLEMVSVFGATGVKQRFGIRKDWPQFSTILDKVMGSMPDEVKQQISRRWIPKTGISKDRKRASFISESESAWLETHPQISVAIMKSWIPLNYVDDLGEPAGVGVDYLHLLEERVGVKFSIVPGNFVDNLEAVKEKRIDLLMDVTPKADREKFLNFTQPYLTIPHTIIGRTKGPFFENEDALTGKTIGLEKGFGNVRYFREKYPTITVIEYPDTLSCLRAVSAEEVDAYAGNRAVATFYISREFLVNLQMQGDLRKSGSVLSLGVRKDWPELAAILDKGVDSFTLLDHQKILQKWVNKAEHILGLTLKPREKSWLEEHPEIRMGVDPAWMPFEGIGQNGQYEGVFSEYVTWLNKKLGISMAPVPGLSWTEVMEKVQTGQIDVMPGVAPTPERRKFLKFTRPYVSIPMVLVSADNIPFLNGLDDLDRKRIAVIAGYMSEEYLRKNHPEIEIYPVSSLLEALKAVQNGDADAALDNLASITYSIKVHNIKGLKIAATTPYTFDLAFGVRKDWPELVEILDRSLLTIPNFMKRSYYDRWVNVQVQSKVDWKQVWKLFALIIGVTALILVVILWWNRKLAKEALLRRLAEERTRLILDSAGDGIFGLDPEGRITFINSTGEKLLGYESNELIGKKVHTKLLHSNPDGSPYNEEDSPMGKAYKEGVAQKAVEEELWRKNGGHFSVEYSSTPICNGSEVLGAVIVFRDITDLLTLNRSFDSLLTNTVDFIYIKDVNHRFITASQTFAELVGYRDWHELKGKTNYDVFPKEYADQYYRYEKDVIDKGSEIIDLEETYERNGELRWVLSSKRPMLDSKGRVVGFFGISRDITERKKIEQALDLEKKLLEHILETSPVGVAFSVDGVLKFANTMLTDTFGLEAGDSVFDRYVNQVERNQLIDKLNAGETVENHELQLYDRQNDIRDMLITYLFVKQEEDTGILGWFIDITDRKRAEVEIQKKYGELSRFRRLAVGREQKMIELKQEINEYLKEHGGSERYTIH